MNVLVLGSTGVLGRNVIPRLLDRGYRVRAVVRTTEQARFLQQAGVDARIGDIFDRSSLDAASYGAQAALHLATAVPRNGTGDWSLNDRIRREGTRNLLDSLERNGVRKYVQQSITLLYGNQGDQIVDETADVQVTALSASAADMEEMVRASRLDWSILRGGIFYGPGTGREDEWRDAARHGQLTIPGEGEDLISLVHVVDMARAVVAAVSHAPPHSLYNIVDDRPVQMGDLFDYLAAQIGATTPARGGPGILPSLGVRNVKAQLELSWQPVFPDYATGLAYADPGGPLSGGGNVEVSGTARSLLAEAIV